MHRSSCNAGVRVCMYTAAVPRTLGKLCVREMQHPRGMRHRAREGNAPARYLRTTDWLVRS